MKNTLLCGVLVPYCTIVSLLPHVFGFEIDAAFAVVWASIVALKFACVAVWWKRYA